MTQLDFPYRISATGRSATTGDADHVRDLIEQVLFTAPGERVMRPDFGSGLLALVFDLAIRGAEWALTPWARAGSSGGSGRAPKEVAAT